MMLPLLTACPGAAAHTPMARRAVGGALGVAVKRRRS
jgi:hypothetical protein